MPEHLLAEGLAILEQAFADLDTVAQAPSTIVSTPA